MKKKKRIWVFVIIGVFFVIELTPLIIVLTISIIDRPTPYINSLELCMNNDNYYSFSATILDIVKSNYKRTSVFLMDNIKKTNKDESINELDYQGYFSIPPRFEEYFINIKKNLINSNVTFSSIEIPNMTHIQGNWIVQLSDENTEYLSFEEGKEALIEYIESYL